MIEREDPIKIYNEILGAKGAKGKLVRVLQEGYYEVMIESAGRNFTSFLPIQSTVLVAAEPEEDIPTVHVER